MAGEDFVQVQLSAAGVKMAGAGGVVHVTHTRPDLVFKAGAAPQRVTRAFDWNAVLSQLRYQGQPIFEVAPASPAPAAKPVAAPPTLQQQFEREHPAPVHSAAPAAAAASPAAATEGSK
jgi:hypothetical protein